MKQRIDELRHGVGKKLDGTGARTGPGSKPAGALARGVAKVSSALPSSGWLALAVASIAGSITLKVMRRHTGATFVAAWVPTFLLLGLYHPDKTAPSSAPKGRERRARADVPVPVPDDDFH